MSTDLDAAELQKAQAEAATAQAEARSATAKADQDEVDAALGRFGGLIPELSAFDRGTFTVAEAPVVRGSALAANALDHAAKAVATRVHDKIHGKHVLVTTDVELADSYAAYTEVKAGIRDLIQRASAATGQTVPPPNRRFALAATAGAAAAALPTIVSLFSARRSVQSQAVSADDTAASVSVSGALANIAGMTVFHDDFRTLPITCDLLSELAELRRLREELSRMETPSDDSDPVRRIAAKALRELIDEFTVAISARPEGNKRSRLTSALLREGSLDVTHILLVNARPGDATQLVSDRPFWFRDQISVTASISVGYLLVDAATGEVVLGGTESATRQAHGRIGKRIQFDAG